MASLPGQFVSVQDDEWGTKCYTHPERDATHRICTESDSFGSEYHNMCDECHEDYKKAKAEREADPEQWETCKCGNREPRLISYRDMDEGMHGPVYEHCSVCHEKWNKRIAEEEAFYDQDDDYDDYDDEPYYDSHDDQYECNICGLDQTKLETIRSIFQDVISVDNIQINVEESCIILGGLDRRKHQRVRRKLRAWFERYTDLYSGLKIEGFIGYAMAEKLGLPSDRVYADSRYRVENTRTDGYPVTIKNGKARRAMSKEFTSPNYLNYIYFHVHG